VIVSVEPAAVLLLGDPGLRRRSEPVADVQERIFVAQQGRLVATLEDFRRRAGFGRAISAPQIGVARRLVAFNLGDGPFVMINPQVVWRSEDTFTLWDDCLSFPDLMVKVRRHESVSVEYLDGDGTPKAMPRLDRALSELIQHELDHLDGVLAVDRALEPGAFCLRSVYEARRDELDAQVDYCIEPTV
jgi:peptide deformylase